MAKLKEGITHLDELSPQEFLAVVKNIAKKSVTEKVDGSYLWFGFDEKGFFTSREKTKGQKYYSASEYAEVYSFNQFRAAHVALQKYSSTLQKYMKSGDVIEIETVFGDQPNTIVYQNDGVNLIMFLRPVSGSQQMFDGVVGALSGTKVTVKTEMVSSTDGITLSLADDTSQWQFSKLKQLDGKKLINPKVADLISKFESWLSSSPKGLDSVTNSELLDIKLSSVRVADRSTYKDLRNAASDAARNQFMAPIKALMLTSMASLVGSRDTEGLVIRDPSTGDQTKLVDKDSFLSRKTASRAEVSARGDIIKSVHTRIAALFNIEQIMEPRTGKKFLKSLNIDKPENVSAILAKSATVQLDSAKTKITAIVDSAIAALKDQLSKYKSETKNEANQKKQLALFAEGIKELENIAKVTKTSNSIAEIIAVIFGRQITSVFNESNSMNLLKQIIEDESGAIAAVPPATSTTVAADIAPVQKRLFRNMVVRSAPRRFKAKKKFAIPEGMQLLKAVTEDIDHENARDADDAAGAATDIEFRKLRNNLMMSKDITGKEVNAYIDKAAELNDEVDCVVFGLELDNDKVVKVYVNTQDADAFEAKMAEMLGQVDNIEDAINDLAADFDIVDVIWPEGLTRDDLVDSTEAPPEVDTPKTGVDPVIDLQNTGDPTDAAPADPAELPSATKVDSSDTDEEPDLGTFTDGDEHADTDQPEDEGSEDKDEDKVPTATKIK